MLNWGKKNKNVSKMYKCPENGDEFGLLSINGKLKNEIIDELQANFCKQGHYINSGGIVSELCIPTLLASGCGSLGITAATSGSLFMATANPATLMAIGNGVGSAVMGSGGIIGQAPFISISGAIMPIAAPLLAFQALSTIMVLQQFNVVNKKLDKVQRTVNTVLQRNEATYIGQIISADSRIKSLEKEYLISHNFSNDMIIRIGLIENEINSLFERYNFLYNSSKIDCNMDPHDLEFKNNDAYIATILSIMDLKIDTLRLQLTLQENPSCLKVYATNLVEKAKSYQCLWDDIQNNPIEVEGVVQSLQESVSAMNAWQKTMPECLGGKRSQRKQMETNKDSLYHLNLRSNTNNMVETAKSASDIGNSIINNMHPVSLLYWQDELGKHSFYTDDIIIE